MTVITRSMSFATNQLRRRDGFLLRRTGAARRPLLRFFAFFLPVWPVAFLRPAGWRFDFFAGIGSDFLRRGDCYR